MKWWESKLIRALDHTMTPQKWNVDVFSYVPSANSILFLRGIGKVDKGWKAIHLNTGWQFQLSLADPVLA